MTAERDTLRSRQMTRAERDRLAAVLARVLADPDAVMRFADGDEGCYRGAPLLQETTGGRGTISVDCFHEDRDNSRIRVLATYSRPTLWSHIFPFSMSAIIRRNDNRSRENPA